MAAYYLDCEFLEGTQKEKFPISLFRKNTPPTIDLISIGIVSEDNREYYAISKDFNLEEAWNRFDLKPDINEGGYKKVYWIRENVLKPIWKELMKKRLGLFNQISLEEELFDSRFTYKNLKNLIKENGKTNKQIADEVKTFTTQYSNKPDEIWDKPEFYAHYGSYDWVCFCWLFGKMIDLPNGFPMYAKDLKQILDEKAKNLIGTEYITFNTFNFEGKKTKSNNIENYIQLIENSKNYPKQENAHNALADAKFNKKLHEFLKNMQNETNKI